MGYNTYFHGGFQLSRPLTHLEVERVVKEQREYALFFLDVEENTTETPQGVLTAKSAEYIAVYDESGKFYDSEDELNTLLRALPQDVEISGYVRADGEDSGDIWRYSVARCAPGGPYNAVLEQPTLTWPDGTVEHGRR